MAQGPFKNLSDLLALIELPSKLGNEKREGLYIRLEDENGLVCRAKMVRPEFQKKHEEEDDWSRKFVRETNVLATK